MHLDWLMGLAVMGSLSLLISSLRHAKGQPGSRARRIAAVAGALGLLWVACHFYWHSHDLYTHSYWGLLRPSSVAIAHYLGLRLLTGATIAMLTFVAFPKGARSVLGISAALFLASILAVISNRVPSHLVFVGVAWSIGLAIPSIVLIRLEPKDHSS